MEQEALFDLLRQQGFRQVSINETLRHSLFEWRVETIVIPHPSGAVYTLVEIEMIEGLLARQTFREASLMTVIETMRP